MTHLIPWPRRRTEAELMSTAVHEAAHYLLDESFGLVVGLLSVRPLGRTEGSVSGESLDRGDPFKAGQDVKQAFGKLLRIDVNNYSSRPAGNMADPADIHVWAMGLRNPLRWSFDRSTGTADLTEGGVQIGDVAAFGEDNTGELYVVARAAGRIYRIEAQ